MPQITGFFLPTPSFIPPQLCRHFPPLWLAGNIFLFLAAVGSSSLTLYIWTNEQSSSVSIYPLPPSMHSQAFTILPLQCAQGLRGERSSALCSIPRRDDGPDKYLPKELQDPQSFSYCANDSICDPKQIISVTQLPLFKMEIGMLTSLQSTEATVQFGFKMHQMAFQESKAW